MKKTLKTIRSNFLKYKKESLGLLVIFLLLTPVAFSLANNARKSSESNVKQMEAVTGAENYESENNSDLRNNLFDEVEVDSNNKDNSPTPTQVYTNSLTQTDIGAETEAPEEEPFDRAAYCMDLWKKQQDAIYGTKSAITQTQNKIYGLMSDIRGRTSGSFVTEAQIQAIYAQEKAVLEAQLSSLNQELQRIKAENPTC